MERINDDNVDMKVMYETDQDTFGYVQPDPVDTFKNVCPYFTYHKYVGTDRCKCECYKFLAPTTTLDKPKELVGMKQGAPTAYSLNVRVIIFTMKLMKIICDKAFKEASKHHNFKCRDVELEYSVLNQRWAMSSFLSKNLASIITKPYSNYVFASKNTLKNAQHNLTYLMYTTARSTYIDPFNCDKWRHLMYTPLYIVLMHMLDMPEVQYYLDREAINHGKENAQLMIAEFMKCLGGAEFKHFIVNKPSVGLTNIPADLQFYGCVDPTICTVLTDKYK